MLGKPDGVVSEVPDKHKPVEGYGDDTINSGNYRKLIHENKQPFVTFEIHFVGGLKQEEKEQQFDKFVTDNNLQQYLYEEPHESKTKHSYTKEIKFMVDGQAVISRVYFDNPNYDQPSVYDRTRRQEEDERKTYAEPYGNNDAFVFVYMESIRDFVEGRERYNQCARPIIVPSNNESELPQKIGLIDNRKVAVKLESLSISHVKDLIKIEFSHRPSMIFGNINLTLPKAEQLLTNLSKAIEDAKKGNGNYYICFND